MPFVLCCIPACGPKSADVETVPSRLLDDGSSAAAPGKTKATKAPITSKSTGRDDLPHFPPPADAQVTDSGLQLVFLARGSGEQHPYSSSWVKVHYEGRTQDGEVFDSSIARGEPASFRVSDVIEGWREAVMLMVEGDRIRAWIPEKIAYKGAEGAPAGLLIFDIELLAIEADDAPTTDPASSGL